MGGGEWGGGQQQWPLTHRDGVDEGDKVHLDVTHDPPALAGLADVLAHGVDGGRLHRGLRDGQPPVVEGALSVHLVPSHHHALLAIGLHQHVGCQGGDAVRRRAGFDDTP